MRLLTLTMLVVALGGLGNAAEIRLKEEAESSGPLVRLGDIAEIEGEAIADGLSLADIALFPSPAAGKSRLVRRQELRQLLALCDVPIRDWEFSGAEAVEIRNAGNPTRTIIRPALHLIPSRSHVRLEPKSTAAGQASDPKADKPLPLVKRNGSVTVHSLAAGVRVTTSGKSLADAAQGQTVLVELADSQEKILARVVGPQLVEIRADAPNH